MCLFEFLFKRFQRNYLIKDTCIIVAITKVVDSNLISGRPPIYKRVCLKMITIFKFVKNVNSKAELESELYQQQVSLDENVLKNVEDIKVEIKKFRDDRVYITKKTRMNSEERMNFNNFHSIIILNLYTFVLLCYSILSLISSVEVDLSNMSLIVSLGVFGASLFVSLYGFREKALAYKMSHLELAKIESKLDILLLDNFSDEKELLKAFEICYQEYNHVISKTENHHSFDYATYKYINKNDDGFKSTYKKYRRRQKFILVLLYGLPFLGWIWYFIGQFGYFK